MDNGPREEDRGGPYLPSGYTLDETDPDVVVLIECAGEGPLEVDPLEDPFCVVLAAGTTLSIDVVVLIVCMDKSPLEAGAFEADPPE